MQTEKIKKAEVAVLITGKIDFKTQAIVRDKEGYNVMLKGTIKQDYTFMHPTQEHLNI